MPIAARRRVKFPLSRGIIAAPASAWGADFDIFVTTERAAPFVLEGAHAVVDVCGPLCQRADWCFDGYDSIVSRVSAALESSAESVVLRIDSPGGDFPGSLEAARDIRAMAAAAGKALIAFTDSAALSAGYGLACAASEIVITPSAYVGSIGVWAALADVTAADKMMGTNVVIVPSGERKADRNPHVAITDDTVAALRSEVVAMAKLFFASVSDARGLPPAAIEALQGAQVFGAAAVAAGLADRVVNSWSEFLITPKGNSKSEESTMSETRKALAKAAEGDGEEATKAKRALKAWDEEEKKAKGEGEEEEKKASAEGEGEEEEGEKKAEMAPASSEKMKVAKKAAAPEDEEKKAAARNDKVTLHALAAELHAMKVAAAAEKEGTERAKLLASRPDITGTVRASLEKASIAFVRDAVANWPRVKGAASASVAAQTPGATRGAAQKSDDEPENLSDEAFIERKMNGQFMGNGIETKRGGRELVLGFMSPKEVAAAAARLAKKEGGL